MWVLIWEMLTEDLLAQALNIHFMKCLVCKLYQMLQR